MSDQSLGELGKIAQDKLKNLDSKGISEDDKKIAKDALGKLENSDDKNSSNIAKNILGKFEGSTEDVKKN